MSKTQETQILEIPVMNWDFPVPLSTGAEQGHSRKTEAINIC